eukprot:GILI01024986.1.p1 GENE.GILI01024986.1~~GILI01024986.1.p1  ORF type:complete len:230 (-),score=13.76 GILI01024986.1:209-898(-)
MQLVFFVVLSLLASLASASNSTSSTVLEKMTNVQRKYAGNLRFGRYAVVLPDPSNFVIRILIDPCRSKLQDDPSAFNCCEQSGEAACEDYDEVIAGPDLLFSWTQNAHVVQCNNEFGTRHECGTFIELHRPLNDTQLYEKRLTRSFTSGYAADSISTKGLCAGPYELWWVVRTRNGRVLHAVRGFMVTYPPCSCADILAAGFSCNDTMTNSTGPGIMKNLNYYTSLPLY